MPAEVDYTIYQAGRIFNCMRKNLLIIGRPSIGKSTLIQAVVAKARRASGFFTREVRNWRRRRVGFEMISSNNQRGVIAHVNFLDPTRTGRFGVKPEVIDRIIAVKFDQDDLLYIDEIGQIQLSAKTFESVVLRFLDSPNTCIVTLSAVYECELIEQIKARPDVILIELTDRKSGQRCEHYASSLIGKIAKARGYAADRSRWNIFPGGARLRSKHDERILVCTAGVWACSCDYYRDFQICSHTLAVEEVARGV